MVQKYPLAAVIDDLIGNLSPFSSALSLKRLPDRACFFAMYYFNGHIVASMSIVLGVAVLG